MTNTTSRPSFLIRLALTVMVVATLAGCASGVKPKAPVENRSVSSRQGGGVDAARLPPGHENAGKPGYFTVRPGDTLIRVALETGQNWRDLQRWNGLENPDRIEVGQVLRVIHPDRDSSSVASGARTPRSESKPVDIKSAAATAPSALPPAGSAGTATASAAATGAAASTSPAEPASKPAPAPASNEDDGGLNWMWPASGAVVSSFDQSRNKGVAVAGKEGDPVVAAADGRVVYAGAGLRGYGNLVIIKHNETFLSAYAHNRTLLVKDEQVVRRGQKIAEMGSTDADRVQLHFEIRRRGKPIDPTKLLPAR